MSKRVLKLIGSIAYYLLITAALLSFIYMYVVNKNMERDIQQLQQEKEQLRIELIEMQIQRDEAIDAIWTENNRQMKEAE